MRIVEFAASGLLIGTLVGLTGMGGGSLMTPLLVLAFGFSPTVAVGTDLLHGAVFKSVGALRHRQLGTVQARLSGWMLLGSAPTSLLGVAVATWLRHHYGSGVFFGLTLLLAFPLRSAKVVGTDVFHAAALLWVAGTGHLIAGNVDLAAVGCLLIGSIPGALLGSHFTLRVPDRALRIVLGLVLIASGEKLVGAPALLFAAPPAALAVGALARRAASRRRTPEGARRRRRAT